MKQIWLIFAPFLICLLSQFTHAAEPEMRQSVAPLDARPARYGGDASAEADKKPYIFAQLGVPTASIAVSADGRLALTGADNAVKVWDVATGREIRTFTGHTDRVISVVFSPDGRYALSGGNDGSWRLWEVATGKTVHAVTVKSPIASLPAFLHVALSPDGKQVLSGGSDGVVTLWDLATGLTVRTMINPPKPGGVVQSVTFSPDGRHALSTHGIPSGFFGAKLASELRLWDITTGQLLQSMQGHTGLASAAFSPDGRHALSGGQDENVKLWDLTTGKTIRTFDHSAWVFSVAISPDGKQGLSGGLNGMKLWDLVSGRKISSFGGNDSLDDSRAAVFSPDGLQALSIGFHGLKIFDIATGTLIRRFHGTNSRLVEPVATAFSSDGRRAASGGAATGIWDVTTGRRRILQEQGKDDIGMTSLAIRPDGQEILAGHPNKTLSLRNANTGNLIRRFEGHSSPVTSIAFSRDGTQALTAAGGRGDSLRFTGDEGDNRIRLWDVTTGKTVRTLTEKNVFSVAMSPDGKQAITASTSGTKLWDLASGTLIRTFKIARAVVFSPDGQYALLANNDLTSSISLLDLGTGQEVRSFKGHTAMVQAVAFNPDGTCVLSGSWDGTLKLWDVAGGREIRTFAGHSSVVNSVAFSSDGRLALSGSVDTSTRVWDVATGKEVFQMVDFDDGEWIAITPDGYYNASPNGDRYLNVRIGNQVYGIENYREAFFRPDVVAAAVAGESRKGYRTIAEVKPPPQVEVVNPRQTVVGDELIVELKLTDTGGGIGDARLYLNGTAVLMDNTRGLMLVAKENKAGANRSYKIRLAQGDNLIRAVVFNADNTMQSNPAELRVTATFTPAASKPALHALVIGINEYKNPKLRLQYAVPDAELFSATLEHGATGLFGKINVVSLTTPAQTTSENITNELKKMQSINPDDLFILFVASHGTVDDGEYFLITSNVGSTSTAKLKTDALSQERIKALIANIPATKKVIMLDTCNAGQLGDAIQTALLTRGMSEDTAFKILSRAVGSTILSSATSTQEALEGYKGHGLFTWVLSEGMKGKADKGSSGYIKTTDLVDYVESEVPEIAENHFKRKQYPTTAVSGQGFPIGKIGL